jgi:hypothetical protein
MGFLRRLRQIGVTRAFVGAGGDWRKDFYVSAGFTRGAVFRPHVKQF